MDTNIKPIDQLAVDEINRLSHEQMAHLFRFAPLGHKYFDVNEPYFKIFMERFNQLGGMTPEVSKIIGWEGDN